MQTSTTKVLAASACLFAGLLAGVTANRALVELPAWRRIGSIPWADFTRAENHGVGSFFYIVIGFLALVATLATAIAFKRDPAAQRVRRFPAYTAALLAIIYGVITRAILVPAAFRLKVAGDSGAEVQAVFVRVARWSGVNDVLHVLAFALSLWAFAEIMGVCMDQSNGQRDSERGADTSPV